MKNRKKAIFFSITAAVLIIVAMILLFHGCNSEKASQFSEGMTLDADAQPYDPSAAIATDTAGGIAIPGYGTIYFPAGETDVQLTLYNPEKNTCLFRFELYIDEDTEPIASTDLIEAGKAVQDVTLSHALKQGEYTLNIKVLPYTVDTLTPLNNALVRAKLLVLANE